TAQASDVDAAATPYAALLGSTPKPVISLQLLPSQCSIKVRVWNVIGSRDRPTAQMSFGPVADRALRKLSPDEFGLVTMLQLEPSQCSISVENPNAAWPEYPTAQTLSGPTATTA